MAGSGSRSDELADEVESRLDSVVERLPGPVGALIEEARESEILLYAGGLAFYALISIAPFVVIGFWIAGAIVGEEGLSELGDNLDEIAPSGATPSNVIDTLAQVGTGAGLGALAAALWPATAYGSGLVRAFDRISHKPKQTVQGLRGRAKALLFLVLLPAFVLGGLASSYLAASLLDGSGPMLVLGWALALVAGFVAALVVTFVMYQVFGPGRLPMVATVQGAAAAAGALALMSLGYVVYLGQGADFEERVAGSGLASVVLLALWLYLANIIVLLGFSFARSRAGENGDDSDDENE
ncbi:MAG: YihY/virulence factor BrkB family protein [Acidimicrobiales bacterium]